MKATVLCTCRKRVRLDDAPIPGGDARLELVANATLTTPFCVFVPLEGHHHGGAPCPGQAWMRLLARDLDVGLTAAQSKLRSDLMRDELLHGRQLPAAQTSASGRYRVDPLLTSSNVVPGLIWDVCDLQTQQVWSVVTATIVPGTASALMNLAELAGPAGLATLAAVCGDTTLTEDQLRAYLGATADALA